MVNDLGYFLLLGCLLHEILLSRVMESNKAEPGAGALILPVALPSPILREMQECIYRLHIRLVS